MVYRARFRRVKLPLWPLFAWSFEMLVCQHTLVRRASEFKGFFEPEGLPGSITGKGFSVYAQNADTVIDPNGCLSLVVDKKGIVVPSQAGSQVRITRLIQVWIKIDQPAFPGLDRTERLGCSISIIYGQGY